MKVSDLQKYKDLTKREVTAFKVNKDLVAKLTKAIKLACSTNIKPGSCPIIETKDHCLEENPYLSIYGDTWEAKVRMTTGLKKPVCINKIVHDIYR